MSDDFFAELQQEFLTESSFMLEQFEEAMLSLESGGSPAEAMTQIFRVAHSIKGGAAAVGFPDLSKFAHVVEDLLALLRNDTSLISPERVSLLLESGDVFKSRIKDLQSGSAGEWNVDDLKARLQIQVDQINQVDTNITPEDSPDLVEPIVELSEDMKPEAAEVEAWGFDQPKEAVVPPKKIESLVPAPAEDVCNNDLLEELLASMPVSEQEKYRSQPKPKLSVVSASEESPEISIEPSQAVAAVSTQESTANKAGLKTSEPSPVSAPTVVATNPVAKPAVAATATPAKNPTPNKTGSGSGNGGNTSIKVDIGRVDSVLDAVGEIVVLKNQLVHDDMVRSGNHPRLAGIVDQLDKLVRELYDKTLSIRMTPLRSLFIKIQRIVRDVSLQLNKPVNLTLVGEDTEVERTVFEVLGDPLVHLVRNALDHGVEPPDKRKEKGKPAVAQVTVSAKQVGGTVVIEIVDDGGGIHRDKILKKAMDKGLMPPGRTPDSLRDEEVFQFIFAPGFSTAEKVTDLSGRGVGLDVVRSNLEKIQGKVDIFSKVDQGSTFRLSIPLSTAITDGILVAAGGSRYILPIYSIREIVRVMPDDYVSVTGHGQVVKIREELIQIVDTSNLFHVSKKIAKEVIENSDSSESDSLRARRGETMLIVIESMKGQAAFPVDDVLGQAQVVVKPLQNGSNIPEVSGAAIMGDGRTVLILDPHSLVRENQSHQESGRGAA